MAGREMFDADVRGIRGTYARMAQEQERMAAQAERRSQQAANTINRLNEQQSREAQKRADLDTRLNRLKAEQIRQEGEMRDRLAQRISRLQAQQARATADQVVLEKRLMEVRSTATRDQESQIASLERRIQQYGNRRQEIEREITRTTDSQAKIRANTTIAQIDRVEARIRESNARSTAIRDAQFNQGGIFNTNQTAAERYRGGARSAMNRGAFYATVGGVGNIAGKGLLGLLLGGGLLAYENMKFQRAGSQAMAGSPLTPAQMASVNAYALNQARNVGADPYAIQQAYRIATDRLGNNPAQFRRAGAAVSAAQQLALPAGIDIAPVVSAITLAQNNFPAYRNNPRAVANIILQASRAGRMTPDQMVNNMGVAVAMSSMLGAKAFPQISAMQAVGTIYGFTPARMQTQLMGLIQHIINPSQGVIKNVLNPLAQQGINLKPYFSLQGLRQLGPAGFIQMLHQYNIPPDLIMKLIPAQRGSLAGALLSGQGYGTLNRVLSSTQNAPQADPMKANWQRYLGLDTTQVSKLTQGLKALAITLGGTLQPVTHQWLTTMLRWSNNLNTWIRQNQGFVRGLASWIPTIFRILAAIKGFSIFVQVIRWADELAVSIKGVGLAGTIMGRGVATGALTAQTSLATTGTIAGTTSTRIAGMGAAATTAAGGVRTATATMMGASGSLGVTAGGAVAGSAGRGLLGTLGVVAAAIAGLYILGQISQKVFGKSEKTLPQLLNSPFGGPHVRKGSMTPAQMSAALGGSNYDINRPISGRSFGSPFGVVTSNIPITQGPGAPWAGWYQRTFGAPASQILDTDYSTGGKTGQRYELPGDPKKKWTFLRYQPDLSPGHQGQAIALWVDPYGHVMGFNHTSPNGIPVGRGSRRFHPGDTAYGGQVVGVSVANHLSVDTSPAGRIDLARLTGHKVKIPGGGGPSSIDPGTVAAIAGGATGMNLKHLPPSIRKWLPQIMDASAATGVPAYVIAAYMMSESGGVMYKNGHILTSSAGALGLMQLEPGTASQFHVNPYNAAQNILGGARAIASGVPKYGANWLGIYENVYNPGIMNSKGGPQAVATLGKRLKYYKAGQNAPKIQLPSGGSPHTPAQWQQYWADRAAYIAGFLQAHFPSDPNQIHDPQRRKEYIALVKEMDHDQYLSDLAGINAQIAAGTFPSNITPAQARAAAATTEGWRDTHIFSGSVSGRKKWAAHLGHSAAVERRQAANLLNPWQGINPLLLPSTGGGGINQRNWLHDQLQADKLMKQSQDNYWKQQKVLGNISEHTLKTELAIDKRNKQINDDKARQRVMFGGGALSHVTPVHLIGRCEAEQRNEQRIKKTGDDTGAIRKNTDVSSLYLKKIAGSHKIAANIARKDHHGNRTKSRKTAHGGGGPVAIGVQQVP